MKSKSLPSKSHFYPLHFFGLPYLWYSHTSYFVPGRNLNFMKNMVYMVTGFHNQNEVVNQCEINYTSW